MAIDGVKIVDSDFAWDIFDDFFERFDAGASPAELREELTEEYEGELLSTLDRELFLTTLAECLWSVGEPVVELADQIQDMLDRDATAAEWDDLYPERKKVLKRFLTRLSKPKTKPVARKKNRAPKKLLFEVGDYLVFTKQNGKQVPVIMWGLERRGVLTYLFVCPNLSKTDDAALIRKLLDTSQPLSDLELTTFFHRDKHAKNTGIEYKTLKPYAERFRKFGNRKFSDDWYGSPSLTAFDFDTFEKCINECGSRALTPEELKLTDG